MDRREELLTQATDHVLTHGLIGLTLRPLASAIGTSDRMLIYHFGTRDQLVSDICNQATERAIAVVDALPRERSVRAGVRRLWATYREQELQCCLTVYVQAAATGLLGEEPYRSDARAGNERWAESLRRYLTRCGAPEERVGRVVTLVDSSLLGFHLDLATDRPDELEQGVDDLARAAQRVADGER